MSASVDGVDGRIVYVDCIGGIAGDMLLAALVDAAAPEEALLELPERLGLRGVGIRLTRVERHSVSALHVAVEDAQEGEEARAHQGVGGRHTSWRAIRQLLSAAELDEHVLATSLDVLGRLASAEASIHGTEPEDVHFHEIGAVDTLVDVVGTVTLLGHLGAGRIVCSPLPIGHGSVKSAHGTLPLPAPATVAVLAGAPIYGVPIAGETATPTGAALVAALADAWGPIPPMTLERVGYGAGTADFPERANLVRVMLGQGPRAAPADAITEVVLLETNLDDLNPELIPDAMEQCFAAGALDVWTAPVTMKKGRPGFVFSTLARPDKQAAVAEAMLRHTSALGVRALAARRYELDRQELTVSVAGREVRVKLGRLDGEIVNIAPEHDDCAQVARMTGMPVKSVWAAALVAARDPA